MPIPAMTKTLALTSLLSLALAAPAAAQSPDLAASGDAAAGEAAFRKCQSCHVAMTPEGEVLAGKKARTGPNLYGVVGRTAGTVAGYRYGKDLETAGAEGMIFDEARFVAYVMDPKGAIQEVLDDPSARSKMAFRVRREDEAKDLYAFLKSLAPAPAGGG